MILRNVWAVGRNYGDHAKELGNAVPAGDADPMIFLKAGSSVVEDGGRFQLPRFSQDIHHEVEVVLRFGPDLKFSEITIGIDLTARDLQTKLKSQGHPWTLAKSFKDSCLLGPWQPAPAKLDDVAFQLRVNGELRQSGSTRDMIHSAEKLRQYVCDRFPVVPGDVLMTGTPSGVAQLSAGAVLEAEITGLLKARWTAV